MLKKEQNRLWNKQFKGNQGSHIMTMNSMNEYMKSRVDRLNNLEDKEQGLIKQLKDTQNHHDKIMYQ